MPYKDEDEAIELARMGRGSLVGSVVTADNDEAARIVLETAAAWHGRILVLNSDCAAKNPPATAPLAPLVHGGPGRAGGGEELGGSRAIKHYMQRTAIQGSPDTLTAITRQFTTGATPKTGPVHPFRKTFDELEIGETLITHRRTVTEADIVNFGCISGDHFYAHFDEIAAKDSLFGEARGTWLFRDISRSRYVRRPGTGAGTGQLRPRESTFRRARLHRRHHPGASDSKRKNLESQTPG